MHLGDKFRSPAKPSRCMNKRCFDLNNNLLKTDNCIFNFTSLNLSLTLNLSLEVYSSTCVLAKHSALEEWKLEQQHENQGHMEILDAFDELGCFRWYTEKKFAVASGTIPQKADSSNRIQLRCDRRQVCSKGRLFKSSSQVLRSR